MKKSAVVLFFSALVSLGALAQNLQQGINDLYAERFDGAKSTFEKLVASKPNDIEANYWLGQAYIAKNDPAGARSVYEKALAATNNAPLLMVGQGQLELMEGKAAEARQHFEMAINATHHKRKGNDPDILNAIGHAIVETYSDQNKTDLDYGIAKLNEAAELAPNNPDIFLNLGNGYRKKRDGGNAVQAYTKAGNFAPALYRIGMIYKTQRTYRQPDEWEVPLDYFNKAIAADEKFAPAYVELYSYYLFGKRDFATAETYANKYVANSDPSVENTWIQAQTKFVQNQFTEAINMGKNILAKTNNNANPRVYRLLAYSYMGNKDTATACQYATEFFQKATNDEDVYAQDYLMHAQACGKNDPNVLRDDIAKAIKKDPEAAARVLDEAMEDARKAQQRILEGELGLMKYELLGEKANPAMLVNIGVPFYYGGAFKKADSLFSEYSKAYPDSIYGYLWSARSMVQLDSTMKQGLAVPAYEQILRIAETDKTRDLYKSSGTQAAWYLSVYTNNVKEDRTGAIAYADRGLAIDPENSNLISLKDQLSKLGGGKQQQKTSTSNNSAKSTAKSNSKNG